MKEPMHETHGTIVNTVTQAKRTGPNAGVKNAGTQRKGGLNEQKNIQSSATPDPKGSKAEEGESI